MTIIACQEYVERAVDRLIAQMNMEQFGEMNEATLQHHLALNIHLDALREDQPNITMTLEKKVRRTKGLFPKKNSATASIDVFFQQRDDDTRCAIELKCFHKVNQREPNNRYDAYADLANLEVYSDEHTDVGFLLIMTDHPHYFDPEFRNHSLKTGDFSLRPDQPYTAGRELTYRTDRSYGPQIVLRSDYRFVWRNLDARWRVLVVKVCDM